jgi:hypothetical protein
MSRDWASSLKPKSSLTPNPSPAHGRGEPLFGIVVYSCLLPRKGEGGAERRVRELKAE